MRHRSFVAGDPRLFLYNGPRLFFEQPTGQVESMSPWCVHRFACSGLWAERCVVEFVCERWEGK